MARSRTRRFKVGEHVRPGLTVLGVLADTRGGHPVYLVWSHSGWCPMACKMLRSPERAREEAEILAAVSHPNIVPLLGRHRDMLLLDLLQGSTLETMAEARPGGRLPVSHALRAAVHIGAALQHIHGRGYLHLDVKPGNVMVTGGRPVLFDFGTARAISKPRPTFSVGTVPYMAPEEAELGTATPASDVFSLGASLYELLTGALPFPNPTRRRPYPQLDAGATPMRSRVPTLPRRLDALIMPCLARDPAARPTLSQLIPELNSCIRTGPAMWPPHFDPRASPTLRGRGVAA